MPTGDEIKSGVSPFEGVFGTRWYGWASKGTIQKTGKNHVFKFLAKLDEKRLREKVERLP